MNSGRDRKELSDRWAADEAMDSLSALGRAVQYQQGSACGGVYTIQPR